MTRIASLGVVVMLVACGGAQGGVHTTAAASDDTDGDGLANGDDRCAEAAEDRDGFDDDDGCPEPDNDGDGISDAADRCPGQPGLAPHGCGDDVAAVAAVDAPAATPPPAVTPSTAPITAATTWYCAVAEHSSICASSEANCVSQATELASWGGVVEACQATASVWCFESQPGNGWSFRDVDCRRDQAGCEGARMLTRVDTRACVQR